MIFVYFCTPTGLASAMYVTGPQYTLCEWMKPLGTEYMHLWFYDSAKIALQSSGSNYILIMSIFKILVYKCDAIKQ